MANQTTEKQTLVEKFLSPNVKTIDPHEVARELRRLYDIRNAEGIRTLRDAYLIARARLYQNETIEIIRDPVDENLCFSAGLADIVVSSGYEASGQLLVTPGLDGPVAKFYQVATGYSP